MVASRKDKNKDRLGGREGNVRASGMRDGPSVQVGGSFIDLSSPNLASCTRGTQPHPMRPRDWPQLPQRPHAETLDTTTTPSSASLRLPYSALLGK